MTKQEKIIEYLVGELKLEINADQVNELLKVIEDHKLGQIRIKRYDYQSDTYVWYRTLEAEDDEIREGLSKYPSHQESKCWLYECINSAGVCKGHIYTIHNNLFQ